MYHFPAVLTSQGSASHGVSPSQPLNNLNNDSVNKASGMYGIFKLRCTMFGTLAEICVKVESALNNRDVALRKMTDVLYNCEYQGLRFEIVIKHVQG